MKSTRYLPLLFILGRLLLLIALPFEGILGYGDSVHFFRVAGMGQPFFDYWVEFPPVFPFLSRFIYQLSGGQEHVYTYLLVLLLSAAQMGSLSLFIRLDKRLRPQAPDNLSWLYFALLSVTAYGWWYFDPLVVFVMLLALVWGLDRGNIRTGLALAVGILLKWFPLLLLPTLWRNRPLKKSFILTFLALGGTALIWGSLFIRAPAFTQASFTSQMNKGSWETVWALLDGNLSTGNFGPELERYDPASAGQPQGNPARLSPYLVIGIFGALGALLYRKSHLSGDLQLISFTGLTLSLFFLALPGWSPQWILYLVPLILLTRPFREAALLAILMLLVSLLEWPVFLSRGMVWGLYLTIPLRTILLLGVSLLWAKELIFPQEISHPAADYDLSATSQFQNP